MGKAGLTRILSSSSRKYITICPLKEIKDPYTSCHGPGSLLLRSSQSGGFYYCFIIAPPSFESKANSIRRKDLQKSLPEIPSPYSLQPHYQTHMGSMTQTPSSCLHRLLRHILRFDDPAYQLMNECHRNICSGACSRWFEIARGC